MVVWNLFCRQCCIIWLFMSWYLHTQNCLSMCSNSDNQPYTQPSRVTGLCFFRQVARTWVASKSNKFEICCWRLLGMVFWSGVGNATVTWGHVGNLRFEMLSSFVNATLIALPVEWVSMVSNKCGRNKKSLPHTDSIRCVCGWFRRIPFMFVWESTIFRCPISHDIPIFLLKPCLYFDTLLKPADLYPQPKFFERAFFFRDSSEKPLGSQSFFVFRGI